MRKKKKRNQVQFKPEQGKLKGDKREKSVKDLTKYLLCMQAWAIRVYAW